MWGYISQTSKTDNFSFTTGPKMIFLLFLDKEEICGK